MYKNEFENNIKKGYFFKSLLLYGEEEFFFGEYTKKIIALLNITNDEKVTIYQDEYNLDTCLNYLSQSSLFGDRNFLILKLNSTKIDKKHIQKLIDATLKNENSYMIIELYDGNFKSYLTSFSKKTTQTQVNHVRFFKPNINEALNILNQKAKALNIDIDTPTLKYIYEHQNNNISLSVNDLNKLVIFDERIDIKMVNNILFNLSMVTKESLIDSILAKKDFKEDLKRFLEYSNDQESIQLVSYISNHIITLIEYNMFLKIHSFADSKAILGYQPPKHLEQKYISQAMKLSIKDFENIINHLLELEQYIKSGVKIDKNIFIYNGLLKLKNM
jgi:DNA polymerase-3 subunit delta